MQHDFRITFQIGKRVWLIRTLMWGLLAMSGLFLSLIVNMPALGEDPTATEVEQIALIIIVVIISIAFPLGMHLYGTCYVARVISNEDESISYYDTIGWIGYRRWTILKDEKGNEQHHKGYTKGFYSANLGLNRMEVNAPYTSQQVSIRKLPFIFDDVGDWYIWPQAKKYPIS